MSLSSVIVQADSSKIKQVAAELSALDGVTVEKIENNQIIAVIEAAALGELEALARKIQEQKNVLGVYPVYIAP